MRPLPWIVTLVLMGYVLLAACSMGSGPVDPQEWNTRRGPVVPHADFPADCSLCHLPGSWTRIRDEFSFDHGAQTGVVLEGAHAAAECLRCHNDRGPVAVFAQRGCAGCHEDVHRAQLGKNCADCHGEQTWQPHDRILAHGTTRMPLVGAHAAVACWRCHQGAETGEFTGLDPDCASCHAADLARASDPDHLTLGWTANCDRCHIPTTWAGEGFNHATFPLTGTHATTDCAECHGDGLFAGTPHDCYACHAAEYQSALDPDHVELGLPTDCRLCHGTWHWTPASFNHGWVTQACVECHLTEYQNTTEPDHEVLQLPTSCQDCHGTNFWVPATFDHEGLTQDCAACHLSDYEATTDPDHEAAGFPIDCAACHNTRTWYGGSFDHDFPINSGDHAGFDCADCHIQPRNFAVFTCTQCHAHQKRDMDDEHEDERGYMYETMACYACHPDGKED